MEVFILLILLKWSRSNLGNVHNPGVESRLKKVFVNFLQLEISFD